MHPAAPCGHKFVAHPLTTASRRDKFAADKGIEIPVEVKVVRETKDEKKKRLKVSQLSHVAFLSERIGFR